MTRESGCLFGVDTSVRDGISNNYLQTRLPSPSRSHVCFSTNVGRETATDSVNVVTRVPSTYNRVIIVPKCLDKSNEQRETLAFFFFSFLFFFFFFEIFGEGWKNELSYNRGSTSWETHDFSIHLRFSRDEFRTLDKTRCISFYLSYQNFKISHYKLLPFLLLPPL